jgi:hypothetical protein
MLRYNASKSQNSPKNGHFFAADRNNSSNSRGGIFLRRAPDAPCNSSSADNFLVENGGLSHNETSGKQALSNYGNSAFNSINSKINSTENSSENSTSSNLKKNPNGYFFENQQNTSQPAPMHQIEAPIIPKRSRLTRGLAPTCSLMDLAPTPSRRLAQWSRAQPTSTSTSTYADDDQNDDHLELVDGNSTTPRAADELPQSPVVIPNPPRSPRPSPQAHGDDDMARPQEMSRNSRNFVAGFDASTKLLDIPCNQMGTLVGLGNSIKFIPDNLIGEVRAVWIKQLEAVFNSSTQDAQSLNLKKLFLLPVILFDNHGRAAEVKATMKSRLNQLFRNDWEALTLGCLNMRQVLAPRELSDDQKRRQVTKFIENGRISRTNGEWIKPGKTMPQDQVAFDGLCELFPEAADLALSDDQINAMQAFQLDDISKPAIDEKRLAKIVHGRAKLIAHGFDHMRAEHLQKLWGFKDDDPQQALFRKYYTKWINMLMCKEIPDEFRPLLCDTEAFAIPKSDGKIRPLGKTNFDRKIASIALQQIHFAEIRAAFGDVQLGCDSKGTEKIIHQFRVIREVDPTLDYSAPDAKNAFNNSNRMIGLHETLQRIPGMFPFVNFLYGQRSNTWFFGLDNGIESIASKEGSQQGCSLGNFLCGMAFLPFILGISLILNGLGISKFFVVFFLMMIFL